MCAYERKETEGGSRNVLFCNEYRESAVGRCNSVYAGSIPTRASIISLLNPVLCSVHRLRVIGRRHHVDNMSTSFHCFRLADSIDLRVDLLRSGGVIRR